MDPHGRAMDMDPRRRTPLSRRSSGIVTMPVPEHRANPTTSLPCACALRQVAVVKGSGRDVDLGAAFAVTACARRACRDDDGMVRAAQLPARTAETARIGRDAGRAFPPWHRATRRAQRSSRRGGARDPEGTRLGQAPAPFHGTAPRHNCQVGAAAPRQSIVTPNGLRPDKGSVELQAE